MTALAASFWDASAIVFLFFNGLYFSTEPPSFSLAAIAGLWLGLCAILALLT